MNRRTLSILAALALALTLLAGCGGAAEPAATPTHDPDAVFVDPNAVRADYGEYGFEAAGYTFGIFDPIDDVLAATGDATGTFEAESCAYQGSDYFYYFSGFELTANEFDGKKLVTYINVIDDTVSIPQGVKIGMAEDEMCSLMEVEPASAGLYRFEHGSSVLQILAKEGVITAIEYFPAGETGE